MARLIALDDSHGMTTAGKRTPSIKELGGRVILENEFSRAVVNYLSIELKRCGFNTLMVAPGDNDISLASRVNLANAKNADAYISIHFDAFDGKFDGNDPEGLTVHVYPDSANSKKLGNAILNHLKGGTSQQNRGVKESNFYVLRRTKMIAILSENGFMDNKREAMLMLDTNFQKEVAREHAKGICDYFNVKYIDKIVVAKPVDKNNNVKTFYRVVTGSFAERSNAEDRIIELKKAGFESFIAIN